VIQAVGVAPRVGYAFAAHKTHLPEIRACAVLEALVILDLRKLRGLQHPTTVRRGLARQNERVDVIG
jgi:hypothetical protein